MGLKAVHAAIMNKAIDLRPESETWGEGGCYVANTRSESPAFR
jgi:hypothetical protein